MDPITHAALGAASAQSIFGKYSKHIPWQIGALAAMAPDLDIFIHFKNNPLNIEFWHRNFTHSFLFIPLGGLLVALFFLCFSRYRTNWKITVGSAFMGYATHGFLDALTSYGTVLLWPWSYKRFSWDVIAIIDPLFTIPLILGTVWSVIHKKQIGVMFGLVYASFFLLFNSIQHHRAIHSMEVFAKKHQLNVTRIRAIPELASSTNWRVITKNRQCLLIAEAYTPIFKRDSLITLAQVPLFTYDNLSNFTPEQKSDLALFSWFSDDYVINAKQAPLTLADGRYTIGNNHSLYSLWGIQFASKKGHVIKHNLILLKQRCSTDTTDHLHTVTRK